MQKKAIEARRRDSSLTNQPIVVTLQIQDFSGPNRSRAGIDKNFLIGAQAVQLRIRRRKKLERMSTVGRRRFPGPPPDSQTKSPVPER